jgi:hypothetical protein
MNTNKVNRAQLARIHILLDKLGRTAYKADYVIDATNGREHSSKQLTYAEAESMLTVLIAEERKFNQKQHDAADTMRKKVISGLRECGYNVGGRADMNRINAWVLQYGYMHKALNAYTVKELPKLVNQADAMRQSFLNRI